MPKSRPIWWRRFPFPQLLEDAFSDLTELGMRPAKSYRQLVRDRVELVPVDKLVNDNIGRISAVGVVPYPPGIPVLMPGEVTNPSMARHLAALQDFDGEFPGFEHEVHGVEPKDGQYQIYCLDRSAER